MDKLTLEHLAPYLPYGLKVQYKAITNLKDLSEHKKKEPKGSFADNIFSRKYGEWADAMPIEVIGDRISELKRIHFYKNHIRLYVGNRHGYLKLVWFEDIKPILRPLSCIDENILFEMFKICFLDIYGEEIFNNCNPKIVQSHGWDENDFGIVLKDENFIYGFSVDFEGQKDFKFSTRNINSDESNSILKLDKLKLFNVMFKHHLDVFGLIDAGLAIDINTI